MPEPTVVGLDRDPWTVAIYAPSSASPVGSGVLVAATQVLTCDHVVARYRDEPGQLEVAFRKANLVPVPRVRVARIVAWDAEVDVAVLELAEPVGVMPAPILCPQPAHLLGHPWWAFGFPASFPKGNDAHGRVGAVLADGYVRLDTESRYVVERGFSGTGVWSLRYQRVVGLVGQTQAGGAHKGDATAVTLHHADLALPEAKLSVLAGWRVDDAGEVAHAAWGWTLAADVEADRHWDPRARGVTRRSERGHRFQGRRAALTRIVGWLDAPPRDRRVLVVTGSPGVGKSAVLGRVVTTADAQFRRRMPADGQVCATVGSVACAVHVKGKTALEVAEEVARAAALRLPNRVEDLAESLYQWLAARPGRACNLVLDALDEATTPADARTIIASVVLPIAQRCAEVGAQVLVATRRFDHGGSLLDAFGGGITLVDLDTPEYFEPDDLAAYALATLQLRGDERPGNPYADPAVARPVAARIAAVAQSNFLVAGLASRAHGLHDTVAVDPDRVAFPEDVPQALRTYLQRLASTGPAWTLAAFTALAHAQAPGLSVPLWQVALAALGEPVSTSQLSQFLASAAANFLIESSPGSPEPVYRLFHQALNDTLLDTADLPAQQRAVAEAFMAHGRGGGWGAADGYLLRSLPLHAAQARLIDTLLADDAYLLHADLARLIPMADEATSAAGHTRARLLRLTSLATDATPRERVEQFSITTVLDRLGAPVAADHPARYRGRWAAVGPRTEYAILTGHTGGVRGVCTVSVGGRTLLASASDDRTVRLWDPATGTLEHTLTGHTDWVRGVCTVSVGGRTLLASASNDRTVRLWDPATGTLEHTLTGHTSGVNGVCTVSVGGRTLLASASADRTVRLWDPATGELIITILVHHQATSCVAVDDTLFVGLGTGIIAIALAV